MCMLLEQCLELPARPTSPRRARRFVADVLRRHGAGGVSEECALLTSELVTNAVLYARSAVDLKVGCGPDRVRVAVGDESLLLPVPRSPSTEAESGRGLALVEALATAWGVEPAASGKHVWFEVAL